MPPDGLNWWDGDCSILIQQVTFFVQVVFTHYHSRGIKLYLLISHKGRYCKHYINVRNIHVTSLLISASIFQKASSVTGFHFCFTPSTERTQLWQGFDTPPANVVTNCFTIRQHDHSADSSVLSSITAPSRSYVIDAVWLPQMKKHELSYFTLHFDPHWSILFPFNLIPHGFNGVEMEPYSDQREPNLVWWYKRRHPVTSVAIDRPIRLWMPVNQLTVRQTPLNCHL